MLSKTLDEMVNLLLPGGRLLIITFHSLEDRIVKDFLEQVKIPVHARRIFRYVYAAGSQREE